MNGLTNKLDTVYDLLEKRKNDIVVRAGEYLVIPIESMYLESRDDDEISLSAAYVFHDEDVDIYEEYMEQIGEEIPMLRKMIHSRRLRKLFEIEE